MIQFDKNDPQLQELLMRCMASTRIFAKTFFPDEVSSEFSLLHEKMFSVIDHPTQLKKALAAPRGLGKTTLAKIRAVKAIVFRERRFIVYLSNSATSAIESTEHIKRMMQENEYINQIFGKVNFSQKGFKDGFSKDSWVAYGDVYILPRGSGQQVRGKNWMGHRPGLFIIDDLESSELVRSDEQREKLSFWFFTDLMKSESKFGEKEGPNKGKGAEFLYIDTIKHEDSLLQNLIDASDWMNVNTPDGTLAICDDNFNTFDPNYMTTEEIKQEYANHKEKGKTDLFFMEYMNKPVSFEDAIFKEEYFKYYQEGGRNLIIHEPTNQGSGLNGNKRASNEQTVIPTRELTTIVICDPARTVKLQAAESAVITWSIHRESHKMFLRDVFSQKVRPDELYEELFRQVLLYRARFLAVEVTGLHEFISQPIKAQMKIRGIFPTYLELNAKGDKDTRISTLSPHYRMGYIYHNAANCQPAENQLIFHPKSKLKDIIDAMSYINRIIDEQYLYFDPDTDDDGYDEYHDLEDEYFDLYDDAPLAGDWRIV